MIFCRSTYVKKVMKLLAFIFEQPSYMPIILKHKKVVEKFVKILFYGEKHSFIEWTYVVGTNNICY